MNRIDREVDRALCDDRFESEAVAAVGSRRVLQAARRAKERRIRGGRRVALLVAVLALGGAAAGNEARERARERAERHAELVGEKLRLQRELEDLKGLLAERSRVSLGGDERTELYVDLARLGRKETPSTSNRRSG
jgi:hypothetical protein